MVAHKDVYFSDLADRCPDSYDKLTAGVLQNICTEWEMDKEIHERDYFKLFRILTESDMMFNETPENEVAIWELTRWVVETPLNYGDISKSIVIAGVNVEIPERIGHLSIGQNIILKQLIEKSRTIEENICIATAIYLQPFVTNSKFDYKEAKKLDVAVRSMPAKDIYPIGFFLLARAWRDGRKRQSSLSLILTSLRKTLRKVLPKWLVYQGSKDLIISRS